MKQKTNRITKNYYQNIESDFKIFLKIKNFFKIT